MHTSVKTGKHDTDANVFPFTIISCLLIISHRVENYDSVTCKQDLCMQIANRAASIISTQNAKADHINFTPKITII